MKISIALVVVEDEVACPSVMVDKRPYFLQNVYEYVDDSSA